MPLPVFFIILASATVLAALAALFASLRAAFGGTSSDPLGAAPGLPDRAALEDEKNALLRALKDLEYENEVGKIADADYQRLDRAYRMRAKQVLTDLDKDLGPYLSQAEELIARSLGEAKKSEAARGAKKAKKNREAREPARGARPADVAPSVAEPSVREDEPSDASASGSGGDGPEGTGPEESSETRVCAKCATENDSDARFCKRCASLLVPDAQEGAV